MYYFNKNKYLSKKVCQIGLWKKKNKKKKYCEKELCWLRCSWKAQDLTRL